MDALIRRGAWVVLAWVAGCAGAPPAAPPDHTADTPWGDEYAGIDEDADLEAALATATERVDTRTSALIETLFDPSYPSGTGTMRSLSANVRYRHTAVRLRRSPYGSAGAVEVIDAGPLVRFVAGAIRPGVGEGALLADARELGTPVARATRSASALRVSPSSSLWGSVLGAGVTMDAGRARVSAAAWRPHDDDSTWTAWTGLEWRFAHTRVGIACGQTARASPAVSVIASRSSRSTFGCVETAITEARVMCAARVVAGDAWRAALAAGAAAPSEAPVGSARRDRRMAVLERRDTWQALASRLSISSVTRRSGSEEERHRRVDWGVRARIDEGVRVEGGLRFGERVSSEAPSLTEPGERSARDEWRARIALSVRERPSPSLEVEHMFRIDAVHAGSSPGLAATWRGTLRRGAIDMRAQASAWGLKPGQLGYLGRGGIPGAGAFTTISGSGSDLSLVVRARLWRHAALAAEWRQKASGDEGFLLGASLVW